MNLWWILNVFIILIFHRRLGGCVVDTPVTFQSPWEFRNLNPVASNFARSNRKRDSCLVDHDGVIKGKHFPRYWPFMRGIHRSRVNSPHIGQWRGALMFSLPYAWINGWVNNREPGEAPSRPLWHHCNVEVSQMTITCHTWCSTRILFRFRRLGVC